MTHWFSSRTHPTALLTCLPSLAHAGVLISFIAPARSMGVASVSIIGSAASLMVGPPHLPVAPVCMGPRWALGCMPDAGTRAELRSAHSSCTAALAMLMHARCMMHAAGWCRTPVRATTAPSATAAHRHSGQLSSQSVTVGGLRDRDGSLHTSQSQSAAFANRDPVVMYDSCWTIEV